METMKGLPLSVYRSARIGDCTNGGITSRTDKLIVVGTIRGGKFEPLPREAQVFEPDLESPAVVLVESALPSKYGPHLEPFDQAPSGYVGPMMGGNYAGSSDSRWAKLGEPFGHGRLSVVPVHDRVESARLYRMLSSD